MFCYNHSYLYTFANFAMNCQKPCEYNSKTKNCIIEAKLSGSGYKAISSAFRIPLSSVKTIIKHFNERGTVKNAPRSGHPPLLTLCFRRQILCIAKKNRFLSHADIANSVITRLHPWTISRVLAEAGFHQRKARCVPYLARQQKKIRLIWARAIQNWCETQFSRILWSDEAYFYAGDSPGPIFVTRAADEANLPEIMAPQFKKSCTKVMVWTCAMWGCKGPLVALDFPGGKGGGMTAKRYQEQVLLGPFLNFYTTKTAQLGKVYFQQDGASCHSSKSMTKWLCDHGVPTFPHLPNSPDMNPMENL